MIEKKNVKLIVQPIYSIIIWIALVSTFVALLVFSNIFWNAQGKLIWRIIFNVCFSLFACLSSFALLYYIQIAVVSDDGILIKTHFRNIIFIEWRSIAELSKQKLVTYNSRGIICLDWIVIKNDQSQVVKMGGLNKKSKGPWQIKYTRKNTNILIKYCRKYRPDLNITTLLSTPQKKK